MVSVLAAVLLSPEKYDPLADDGDEQSKPVKASTPSSPPPKPKPKPEAKPEAKPQPEAKPEPKPAPAAKKVRLAVLSGVPQPGAAAKEAKRLKGKGFPVRTVGNAPGGAERSAVFYARGQQAAARDLAEAAGIASVKALDAQTAEPARGAKLVVVVGAAR